MSNQRLASNEGPTQFFSRRAMMRGSLALVAGLAIVATSPSMALANVTEIFSKQAAASTKTVDHSAWDAILKAHIKPNAAGLNMFDYAAAKANASSELKAYVKQLEAVDPTKLNANEQFAFWANLYNAKTIDVVLDNYPVESIRKITINEGLFGFLKKSVGAGGPWKAKIMTVSGQKLSLDDVEHEIMRKVFKDPRVHYAVNCASIGCPNLNINAFTGANLEAELDKGAVAFINHPRGISVKADGSISASSIYSWFQVDFGGSPKGVIDHAMKYAKPELAAKLKGKTEIASYGYDWSLNDTSPSGS
ncbi:MAG: DUF547 domain-containing protein [Pseudomonadota bacterium]